MLAGSIGMILIAAFCAPFFPENSVRKTDPRGPLPTNSRSGYFPSTTRPSQGSRAWEAFMEILFDLILIQHKRLGVNLLIQHKRLGVNREGQIIKFSWKSFSACSTLSTRPRSSQ